MRSPIVTPDKRRSRADPGSIAEAAKWIPALACGSAGMTIGGARYMGLNARKGERVHQPPLYGLVPPKKGFARNATLKSNP